MDTFPLRGTVVPFRRFEGTSEDHRIAGNCSRCRLEGQY
jgi:hypothetical protein